MVPVIELRGAIIAAAVGENALPWLPALLICIVGNMIPVPFILLFIRKILDWMKTTKKLCKIALWVEKKGEKNKGKVAKYSFLGLMLFVGIPLPGTGAWTGALAAAMLDMRMKRALPAVFLGVVMAGIIMTLAAYGSVSFLSFLL